jgi:Dyp-type peroxidase family
MLGRGLNGNSLERLAMTINLDNIQGNIFGAFNKDFQDFLFLKVKAGTKARKWVRENSEDLISTSDQVLAFNNAFKALLAEGIAKPETIISARWANLAFSYKGLQAMGFTGGDLGNLPKAFTEGMAARKTKIGDIGTSDPQHWDAPFAPATQHDVHAILLVAADSNADLAAHVATVTGSAGFSDGFDILGTVNGRTRMDIPGAAGHEHFGFKDGVSQPGVRGIDSPDDPLTNPDQGHPGQDLLWPGEFVLGYPTQKPKHKDGHDGPNPEPGKLSIAGNSAFTADGSFLVFRRLAQDVPAFESQVAALATANGLHVDLMGAKLVGRYKSGCPIEALSMQPFSTTAPSVDPGIAIPKLASSDALNNAFEFGQDADGKRCPLSAHIRKAYPRDEDTGHGLDDSESETQTHRLLRRGIPYGTSFGATVGGGPNVPRGLCFLAYQNDIEAHFEFVQKRWVNDPKFPPEIHQTAHVPGEDPIISQTASGPFELPPNPTDLTVSHFVKTTGGEYFFSPSLLTLTTLF